MRLMADSTNLDDIPAGRYPLIAYYVDGGFQPSAAQLRRHVNAGSKVVPITVGANPQMAVVGDVETGDYTPAEAPDFVLVQRGKGIDPTVYCNLNSWPAVRKAFLDRGVVEPHYWIAAYPGIGALLYTGSIAHQYLDDAAGTDHYSGGHWDVSVVADFWPGVDGAFGPGGFELLDQTDPIVVDILKYLDRLDTNVKDLYFALGLPQPNPADPTTAKSSVLEALKEAVATLQQPTLTVPTQITMHIPAVPGDATGSLHS